MNQLEGSQKPSSAGEDVNSEKGSDIKRAAMEIPKKRENDLLTQANVRKQNQGSSSKNMNKFSNYKRNMSPKKHTNGNTTMNGHNTTMNGHNTTMNGNTMMNGRASIQFPPNIKNRKHAGEPYQFQYCCPPPLNNGLYCLPYYDPNYSNSQIQINENSYPAFPQGSAQNFPTPTVIWVNSYPYLALPFPHNFQSYYQYPKNRKYPPPHYKHVGNSHKAASQNDTQVSCADVLTPKTELSERCLQQRQKHIDYGKNTIGYKRYLRLVPKNKRSESDPGTPDIHAYCSKRSWSANVRSWRLALHKWDPPDEEILRSTPINNDQDDNFKLDDIMSRLILSPTSNIIPSSSLQNFQLSPSSAIVPTPGLSPNLNEQLNSLPISDPHASSSFPPPINDPSSSSSPPPSSLLPLSQLSSSLPAFFDSKNLEHKLKMWDEKFERCFRSGHIKGDLETGSSFFSSPFSGFGFSFKSNDTHPQYHPGFLAPFAPSVVPTNNKIS